MSANRTTLERHPLDLRRCDAQQMNGTESQALRYNMMRLPLYVTPPLDVLLEGDPSVPLVAGDVGCEPIAMTATDVIAFHLADALSKGEDASRIDRWLSAQPIDVVERFTICLSVRASNSSMDTMIREQWEASVLSYLQRPGSAGALPTAERAIRLNLAGHLSTPEHTLQLRESGWRDAAGRSIDTLLVEGASVLCAIPRPPSADEIDRSVAQQLDSRLRPLDRPLTWLVPQKGVVLDPRHRQALADLLEAITLGPTPPYQHLKAFTRLTFAVATIPSADVVRDLLDADRANRSMSQRAAAAELSHAPSEISAPLTL